MRVMTLTAALAATLAFANVAHARDHHYRHGGYHAAGRHFVARHPSPAAGQDFGSAGGYQSATVQALTWTSQSTYHGGLGARPRAWCGWQMRQMVGGDPGPEYNLARNWARWGHAGPPGVGAVVVWSHHVGMIVGQENGHWLIQSGNDGNRVRTRPLPISNAIAIRWG